MSISMSFQKLFYNPIFSDIGNIRPTVVQSPKNVDLGVYQLPALK